MYEAWSGGKCKAQRNGMVELRARADNGYPEELVSEFRDI